MTSTQQNGGIEDRLATDGLTSRSGMVQGGKESLMAGTGSLEARAVPIPVVVPAELGMKFVARFPVLGPRIQPSALDGDPPPISHPVITGDSRLNQRPRKTLGFQTPATKLQASVASIG